MSIQEREGVFHRSHPRIGHDYFYFFEESNHAAWIDSSFRQVRPTGVVGFTLEIARKFLLEEEAGTFSSEGEEASGIAKHHLDHQDESGGFDHIAKGMAARHVSQFVSEHAGHFFGAFRVLEQSGEDDDV